MGKAGVDWGINVTLSPNSYWIGEDKPCLTYCMRGLIKISVNITGAA